MLGVPARPGSDWDVIALTVYADRRPEKLFLSNQSSKDKIDGGKMELVIAHPDHWNDQRRYMIEVRESGFKLR